MTINAPKSFVQQNAHQNSQILIQNAKSQLTKRQKNYIYLRSRWIMIYLQSIWIPNNAQQKYLNHKLRIRITFHMDLHSLHQVIYILLEEVKI